MRKHAVPLIVVAIVAGLILAWLCRNRPDPAAWPRCEYFRCRGCGGPASIDPDQPERWGCRACGFSTFHLAARFRCATRADFGGDWQRHWEAAVEAGGAELPSGRRVTPIDVWNRSH